MPHILRNLFKRPFATCLCGRVVLLGSWPESHGVPVRAVYCGYCGWGISREQYQKAVEKAEEEKKNGGAE